MGLTHRTGGRLLVVVAMLLAALATGCGTGARRPGALAVRCSGPSIPVADGGARWAGDNRGNPQPRPFPGLRGGPKLAGVVHGALPAEADPGDLRYGYLLNDWRLSRVAAATGRTVWSVTIPVPADIRRTSPHPDLYVSSYPGYVVVHGFAMGRGPGRGFVAAVTASGRSGPACVLPGYAHDDRLELLPHAGVLVVGRTPGLEPGLKGRWVDSYSTTTGKRLWAQPDDGFTVSGDSVYLWAPAGTRTGENGGDIASYQARTGKRRWHTDPGDVSLLTSGDPLAVFGGRVYAFAAPSAGASWQLVALRAGDGKVLWRTSRPAVSGYPQDDDVTLVPVGATEAVAEDSTLNKPWAGASYLLDASDGAVTASLRGGAAQIAVCYPGGTPAVAVAESGRIRVLSADPAADRTIAIPAGDLIGQVDVVVTDAVAYVRKEAANAPVMGFDLATGRRAWTVAAPGVPSNAQIIPIEGGFFLPRFDAAPGHTTPPTYAMWR